MPVWYDTNQESELSYNKPIMAIAKIGDTRHMLMPCRGKDTNEITHYDWFCIDSGEFNSGVNWINPRDAVKAYLNHYRIVNFEFPK